MDAFSMLGTLGSDDSLPTLVAVVLAALVVRAIYVRVRRPRRPPARGRRAPATPKKRCREHKDKVVFATEHDAESFVAWTQQRHAAGRWSGKPMDHSYRCPARDHWHVSSKPRRPS